MKKFTITTAIPYASGKSHIGNVYEDVLADAIARYKRKKGYDVYFQVGLDEHGLKIEEKAREKGISPQEHVDNIVVEFKDMLDIMSCRGYDHTGYYFDDKIMLGHKRLAIIDINDGNHFDVYKEYKFKVYDENNYEKIKTL